MSRYNNRYGNSNTQAPQKKKSGAKEMYSKKDGDFIGLSAWNHSKDRGLVTVKGFINSKSVESQSDRGNKFVTIMLEVFYHRTGNRLLELVNYNKTSGKCYLDKMNWVLSTKANNGGYLGRAQ